jgi:hypothetical protein
MNYCRYLLYGLLALSVSGCGQTVTESLKVQPAPKSTAGADRSIVILPFADYSYADDLESAFRRNLYVTENLTDELGAHSFNMPVQEDVFRYLANQRIINVLAYEERRNSHLQNELQGEWSPVMKKHLQRYNDLAKQHGSEKSVSESPGTHALTQQEVVKIGRQFGADYIVRGRIIEYKTRKDPSWSPLKKGVLTFITGSTGKLAWGNASSDTYDLYAKMIAGAVWGGVLGNEANWPWETGRADQTILGISGGEDANTIFWSAAGSEFGRIGHNSGENPQAVVQLRMWVQDAYTGDVVWTNRVDVKVSAETVFGDAHYDALFESATEKAIVSLVDNFVSQAL